MKSFSRARRQMVEEQIKRRGIRDPSILKAFLSVPRHQFVPLELRHRAYEDAPLPIGEGQTISQPYMVALMLQAAEVRPGQRVLEVGTGSGYQTALLAEMGAQVFTVERRPELGEQAALRLRELGYLEVSTRVADGTLGWEEHGPYGAILVSAGSPVVPPPLVDQLARGGRLVIPIEERGNQVLYTIWRTPSGLQRKRGERCTFVPLVGKHGWKADRRR